MLRTVPNEDEFAAKITLIKMWVFALNAFARQLTPGEIDELRGSAFFIERGIPARDVYNQQMKELCAILVLPGGLENITEDGMFDLLLRISNLRELLREAP